MGDRGERSLRLSQVGQQLARQALRARGWTQKTLTIGDRQIASWTTINKFFNGKPVDRLIFNEICECLNLDPQAVIELPEITPSAPIPVTLPSPSSSANSSTSTNPLFSQLRSHSHATREALTPRILQRISRGVVREKYLPAIQRGLTDDKIRVVGIVGPAGYGKSTILGDIYDQLMDNPEWGAKWVGLMLCANLLLPAELTTQTLELAMGQCLWGEPRSIVELARELTQQVGRGVILIDTLDLILKRPLVIALAPLLRSLVQNNINVVFTCRDREYQDLLEPTREKLSGLVANLDRHSLWGFTKPEIRQATTAFFQTTYPDRSGDAFAQEILQLSADNRSLEAIIENPLLLALLCDLFAAEGQVPYDLTVSKLYERYWYEKVTYYRPEGSHEGRVAIAKETVCLTLARTLFELSDQQLQEALYLDELPLDLVPPLDTAYGDLLSEGVLTYLTHRRLHFFHQTLLEYALAYWLSRQSARPQRQQLFEKLHQPDAYTWLPILRQLLTIVGTQTEYDQLVAQLDLQNLGIFTAVAYAAASREQPDALANLLPMALDLGEPYQQRLRQAFSISSRFLIEQTWELLLTLLATAEHITAGNTAKLVGNLLDRWWSSLWLRLDDTLAAIARRTQDDQARLYGWLLSPCMPLLAETPQALAIVRQMSLSLGHGTCAAVVVCHVRASVADRCRLLQVLLQQPVLNYPDIDDALVDLVASLLPQALVVSEFSLGSSWERVLDGVWPDRWDLVQVKAVGRWAARDTTVLLPLFDRLLFGPPESIQRSLAALLGSIAHGAGSQLIDYLLQLEPSQPFDVMRFKTVLIQSVPQLSVQQQERLAHWVIGQLDGDYKGDGRRGRKELLDTLNYLADDSLTARQGLLSYLPQLPKKQRQLLEVKLLRFQPIEQHPPLHTFNKSGQRFLLGVYQQQAATNSMALEKILQAVRGRSKDVAISASHALVQVSGLLPTQILFLLESPFAGVRVNGLVVLAQLDRAESSLDALIVSRCCQLLATECDQAVARHLCDVLAPWVKREQQVPEAVLQALVTLPGRLAKQDLFDGGTARSLMATLKVIAQSESADVVLLGQAVHQLVTSIHIVQINNGESELLDVLTAMQRLDATFLSCCLERDGAALVACGWERNVAAILKAVQRVDGSMSDLFDRVQASDWCTEMLLSLIVGIRTRL